MTGSDSRQRHEQEPRAVEELQQALRSREDLLHGLLALEHRLPTPLNAIIGFSRLMLKGVDGPLTETQQDDLQAIHAGSRDLLTNTALWSIFSVKATLNAFLFCLQLVFLSH